MTAVNFVTFAAKMGQQPHMLRHLLLAGGLIVVLVGYLLAEHTLSAASQPPVLPQRAVSSVGDAPKSDNGYFLKEYDAAPTEEVSQPWWALVADVTVKLAIVLGLIYGAARVLRRYGGTARLGLPAPGRSIKVLEATPLGHNRSLFLVSVGGKVLLLGATTGQLSTLTEFVDPAQVAGLTHEPPAGESTSFKQQLDDALAADEPNGLTLHMVEDPLIEGRDFLQRKIAYIQSIATAFRKG